MREWERWGRGTIKEWSQSLRPVLRNYWLIGTGRRYNEPGWWSKHPWSAAFIRAAYGKPDLSESESGSTYLTYNKLNAFFTLFDDRLVQMTFNRPR